MLDLNAIRFVVGTDGQPSAVQVDIGLWQQIVAALEDAEDLDIARAALAELTAAGGNPAKAGWLPLKDILEEWRSDAEI